MRITARKAESRQGRVLWVKAISRSNGHQRKVLQTSLWQLSVVVEFLNQQYDEYGIAIWNRDTSLLGFLYNPFLDPIDDSRARKGLSKQELLNFYADTKAVQKEMVDVLTTLIRDGNERPLAELLNNLPDTQLAQADIFRASLYSYIVWLYDCYQLRGLGRCPWCSKFFSKPHPKDKYCSDECCRLFDQQHSGARHDKQEKRMTYWLTELLLKPTRTAKQRQEIDHVVRAMFGTWKKFDDWKSKVQFSSKKELLRSVSEEQKRVARASSSEHEIRVSDRSLSNLGKKGRTVRFSLSKRESGNV
jgi:hypothetical protein